MNSTQSPTNTLRRAKLLSDVAATSSAPANLASHAASLLALDRTLETNLAAVDAATTAATKEQQAHAKHQGHGLRKLSHVLIGKGEDYKAAAQAEEDSLHVAKQRKAEAEAQLAENSAKQKEAATTTEDARDAMDVHVRSLVELEGLQSRGSEVTEDVDVYRTRVAMGEAKAGLQAAQARQDSARRVKKLLGEAETWVNKAMPVFADCIGRSQMQGWVTGGTFADGNEEDAMVAIKSQFGRAEAAIEAARQVAVEVDKQAEITLPALALDTSDTKSGALFRRMTWDGLYYQAMNDSYGRMIKTRKQLHEEIKAWGWRIRDEEVHVLEADAAVAERREDVVRAVERVAERKTDG